MTIENLTLDKEGIVRFGITFNELSDLQVLFEILHIEPIFESNMYFTKGCAKIDLKYIEFISKTIEDSLNSNNILTFIKSDSEGKRVFKSFGQSLLKIKCKIDYWLKCIELRLV